jgi:hypothetical protein
VRRISSFSCQVGAPAGEVPGSCQVHAFMHVSSRVWIYAGSHAMKLVVPSREQATMALSKLCSSARLCARLVQLSVGASELLFAQMSRSFFVPLCMTASAACASVRIKACVSLMQTITLYNVLLPLSAAFPLHARGCAAVGQALPESLGVNWSDGVPHLQVNAFTEQDGYQQLVDASAAQYSLKHYTQPTAAPIEGAASCQTACTMRNINHIDHSGSLTGCSLFVPPLYRARLQKNNVIR